MDITHVPTELLLGLPITSCEYCVLVNVCKFFRTLYWRLLPDNATISGTVIKILASYNSIELCKYFGRIRVEFKSAEGGSRSTSGGFKEKQLSYAAAESGSLDLLKWSLEGSDPNDMKLCEAAAEGGQLDALRWLRWRNYPWRPLTFVAAVKCTKLSTVDYFALLQWFRDNYCPKDERVGNVAIMINRLDTLKWLRSIGCLHKNDSYCGTAARYGNIEILQWLFDNGFTRDKTIRDAAYGGHLHVIKWAMNNGCVLDEDAFEAAAACGHIDVLQFLEDNACPWTGMASRMAAKHGQLKSLKWIRKHGYSINVVYICEDAAEGMGKDTDPKQQLKTLQWLRKHNCYWDEMICRQAAARGDLAMLIWARENVVEDENGCSVAWPCPWDSDVLRAAAHNNHLHIIEWAYNNGCPWTDNVCYEAVSKGYLHILEWVKEHVTDKPGPWSEEVIAAANAHVCT